MRPLSDCFVGLDQRSSILQGKDLSEKCTKGMLNIVSFVRKFILNCGRNTAATTSEHRKLSPSRSSILKVPKMKSKIFNRRFRFCRNWIHLTSPSSFLILLEFQRVEI